MFAGFFGFQGRIGRGSWWFAQLAILLIWAALTTMAFALHAPKGSMSLSSGGAVIFFLIASLIAAFIVNLSSTVKRYHDRGKSGWWFLMNFAPFIGGIWVLIECGMLPGDESDNDYGPPPGAEKRSASFGQEIADIATSQGKLAKLDDAYIANYAKNIAMQQAKQPTMHSNVKPAFGKR
jgi:uncharacterized membrane protein YhaH (DUF805 family)